MLAAAGPTTVPGMLEGIPIMVGVPEVARSVADDGTYVMDKPTAFSDRARIISGQFETSFNDPAGNSVRFHCDVPGHEQAGMHGEMHVR